MSMELREEAMKREEERQALIRRREEFLRDVKFLATCPEGKRFFRWLIDQGNIFAEDYQPGYMGAYRAGMRAMSLRLWRILEETLSEVDFIAVTSMNANKRGAVPDCETETALTEWKEGSRQS